MTLADLRTNLARRLNYPDTLDTATQNRLTMFLNQRHRALLTAPALRQLREGFGSFASVAAQSEYALPYGVDRITNIREATNQRTLAHQSWDWYRATVPDPATMNGTPDTWCPIGVRAVAQRPAGTGIWAASDNAGDTTQNVSMAATLSSSNPRGALHTSTTLLTGTTRVRLAGTNTFDDVVTLSLSAACTGTLSFFDAAAAGNTLATMLPGRRTSRLFCFALVPTPVSALTYAVDFEHALIDLSNTWDEPLLPEDFHDLLIEGALMDEYEHRDDDRYASAERRYRTRLSELKAHLYGHRLAASAPGRTEVAPLGSGAQAGWFPRQYL